MNGMAYLSGQCWALPPPPPKIPSYASGWKRGIYLSEFKFDTFLHLTMISLWFIHLNNQPIVLEKQPAHCSKEISGLVIYLEDCADDQAIDLILIQYFEVVR